MPSRFKIRRRFVLEIPAPPHVIKTESPFSQCKHHVFQYWQYTENSIQSSQDETATRKKWHEGSTHRGSSVGWGATSIHSAMKARGGSSKEDSSFWKKVPSSCLGVNDKTGGKLTWQDMRKIRGRDRSISGLFLSLILIVSKNKVKKTKGVHMCMSKHLDVHNLLCMWARMCKHVELVLRK